VVATLREGEKVVFSENEWNDMVMAV